MNKYLMLSAAAALATTGVQAGTLQHSFTFGTAGGGAYCDGGTVYTSGSTVWSWVHNGAAFCSQPSYGQGLLAKNATYGKGANMSDTFFGQYYGIFSEYLSYTLPGKLKNGKPWELWLGLFGTTSFEANAGVLISVAPQHKGGKSTVAGLKQLIAVHKAAMHKN